MFANAARRELRELHGQDVDRLLLLLVGTAPSSTGSQQPAGRAPHRPARAGTAGEPEGGEGVVEPRSTSATVPPLGEDDDDDGSEGQCAQKDCAGRALA